MAEAATAPGTPRDKAMMREAIALAAQAEVPFGALIVRDGEVLARGFNEGKRMPNPDVILPATIGTR
jgi:tRNA(Arg) A34 adenosine deaminase TadA